MITVLSMVRSTQHLPHAQHVTEASEHSSVDLPSVIALAGEFWFQELHAGSPLSDKPVGAHTMSQSRCHCFLASILGPVTWLL